MAGKLSEKSLQVTENITALKSSERVSMKLQKTPQLSLSQFQSTELSLLFFDRIVNEGTSSGTLGMQTSKH